MKIGILTFHRASNYGAVLQAYALTEVLREYHKDTEIVNYYCPEVEMCHHPNKLFRRQNFISACIHYYGKWKKYRIFEDFRRRKLQLSEKYEAGTLAEASRQYAVFISGSDQVWSKKYSGMDTTYLLDFEKDPQKKYSYAASFGFTAFPDGTRDIYAKYLKEFQAVSVRENSAVSLLASECDVKSFMSLDPTLVLSTEKWRKFAKYPEMPNKYILIYHVQPPLHLMEYAKKLSAETGCGIVYLNSSYTSHRELNHARFSTPEQFAGWFANAEYVLTNSFHGTAFSIIFQKNLVVEIETKLSTNTRSRDLLQLCGLENRILPENYRQFELTPIDWEVAATNLNAEREKSLTYLRKICEKCS